MLLTAAHCIDSVNHPGWTCGIFRGEDASAYTTLVELEPYLLPVASVHLEHLSYSSLAPFAGSTTASSCWRRRSPA